MSQGRGIAHLDTFFFWEDIYRSSSEGPRKTSELCSSSVSREILGVNGYRVLAIMGVEFKRYSKEENDGSSIHTLFR